MLWAIALAHLGLADLSVVPRQRRDGSDDTFAPATWRIMDGRGAADAWQHAPHNPRDFMEAFCPALDWPIADGVCRLRHFFRAAPVLADCPDLKCVWLCRWRISVSVATRDAACLCHHVQRFRACTRLRRVELASGTARRSDVRGFPTGPATCAVTGQNAKNSAGANPARHA